MQLHKLHDGSVHLSRLNSWDVQTFRSLPALADYSADPMAEKRLLPAPAIDQDLSPEMAMDWVEYVMPELRESFAHNLETVLADLQNLAVEPEPPASEEESQEDRESPALRDAEPGLPHFGLTIPADHVEHWYRAMNQARIVLSARYGIDSEHVPDLAKLLETGQLEKWFQYELFVSLQGWLVEVAMNPD
jgi:hypothetical protein